MSTSFFCECEANGIIRCKVTVHQEAPFRDSGQILVGDILTAKGEREKREYRVYKLQLHLLHSDTSPARSAVLGPVFKKKIITQGFLRLFCATDPFDSLMKHTDPSSHTHTHTHKCI